MKKKNYMKILTALIVLSTPNIVFATTYLICDEDKKIPYAFATMVSTVLTLIKILVPVFLVIGGMISFFKVAASSNVDEDMKKAKSKLINSIIAAIIVFFTFSIANFVVTFTAGNDNNIMSCAKCFLKPEKCKTKDEDSKVCPGYLDQEYDDECNPIGDKDNKTLINTTTNPVPSINPTDGGNSNNTDTPKAPKVTMDQNTNTSGVSGPKKQNEEVYINGILVVNKTYSIPREYAPDSAKGINGECTDSKCFTTQTWNAWNSLKDAATFDGIHLKIGSGYRSYDFQNQIYMNYVARDGAATADTYSARPGHSEHQTGLAMDICSTDGNVPCITSGFDNSAEAKWLSENCYKYGFIIRYPQGKEDKTGYKYESWHIRYVGTELAKTLYNNGNWISIEEYFDITSQY